MITELLKSYDSKKILPHQYIFFLSCLLTFGQGIFELKQQFAGVRQARANRLCVCMSTDVKVREMWGRVFAGYVCMYVCMSKPTAWILLLLLLLLNKSNNNSNKNNINCQPSSWPDVATPESARVCQARGASAAAAARHECFREASAALCEGRPAIREPAPARLAVHRWDNSGDHTGWEIRLKRGKNETERIKYERIAAPALAITFEL